MAPQQKGGMLQAPVSGRKKRRQKRGKPKKAFLRGEITKPTKVVNSKAAPELNRREPINKAHMELPFFLKPDTFVTLIVFDSERFIPWFSEELQNRATTAVIDYLEHDIGRTFKNEQTFHMWFKMRTLRREAHTFDALTQMRRWLEAWHEFYSLKDNKICVNKIEELQAIAQSVRYPTIKGDNRKEASDQLSGPLVGRGLNLNRSGSEIASTDTLVGNEYLYEPQIQQKEVAHTFGDTQSPASALTFQDTDMLGNQYMSGVTGGLSDPLGAETQCQNVCPFPPGYINLEDPFGNIHKIGVDQHLQCAIEGLVAMQCCHSDPEKVQLVTSQRYELYTMAASILKPCIRVSDIVSGDYVKMCFKT